MKTTPSLRLALLLCLATSLLCRAQTLRSLGVPAYYPALGNNLNSPWTFTSFVKMSTDGSMMVGGHGGSSGARPWKWTNGWWEYMHDQGARVNMSVDGQTTIMHGYFPDLANYASRVYQEGRLVMTFTDRTIWDASFGGQKLMSTRQDWSLSGNVAVERGLPVVRSPRPTARAGSTAARSPSKSGKSATPGL